MVTNHFVDSDLACRLESGSTWRGVNYAHGYQRSHPEAACAVEEIAGGFAIYVRPGSPLNSARGLGMNHEVRPRDIEAMEDFFYSRGQPAQVHVCPLAHESLFQCLRSAGYRLDFFFSQLFYPILSDFRPQPLPEELRLVQAGPDLAERWLRVVAEGFDETDQPPAEAFDILGPNFYAPESAAFLAYVQEQPAGGGGMYFHDGVVELGGASTRVAFRRRGVQRALIEARLAAARALGCDLAVVLTDPGSHSQRNLQRFGFQLAYSKVVMVKEYTGPTEYRRTSS